MTAATRWRTLTFLSLASAAWAFSFGLAVPLGALWLRDHGCSNQFVGFNTTIYYVGVAGASLFLPRLMRRHSRPVVLAGMIVDGLLVALFPWVGGWVAWLALRLCAGIATALCLIPMETLVNYNAPPKSRARDFAVYAVAVALGLACGPLVGLPLYPVAPHLAFFLGGLVALLGALLLWWGFTADQEPPRDQPGVGDLSFRANLLSLGTAWVQGFMEGGMLTFLSVYLLGLGYTTAGASALLGAMFLGVVLVQVPGAMVADRWGRQRVVLTCHVVVLAGLLVLPYCRHPVALVGGLFAVGATGAALYPLGLALLGERVPPGALARANSWYLACNCVGSLTGPWLMGKMIDLFGRGAMYGTATGAVGLVLGLWALLGRATPAEHPLRSPALEVPHRQVA